MMYLSKKKIDRLADIYMDIFEIFGLDDLRQSIKQDFPCDVRRITKAVLKKYSEKK